MKKQRWRFTKHFICRNCFKKVGYSKKFCSRECAKEKYPSLYELIKTLQAEVKNFDWW